MAICVTAGLQPAIQRTMHGFIINENNFQNYNEYTYKAVTSQFSSRLRGSVEIYNANS